MQVYIWMRAWGKILCILWSYKALGLTLVSLAGRLYAVGTDPSMISRSLYLSCRPDPLLTPRAISHASQVSTKWPVRSAQRSHSQNMFGQPWNQLTILLFYNCHRLPLTHTDVIGNLRTAQLWGLTHTFQITLLKIIRWDQEHQRRSFGIILRANTFFCG